MINFIIHTRTNLQFPIKNSMLKRESITSRSNRWGIIFQNGIVSLRSMSNSNDPLRLADSPYLHANPGCIWYACRVSSMSQTSSVNCDDVDDVISIPTAVQSNNVYLFRFSSLAMKLLLRYVFIHARISYKAFEDSI